MPSKTQGRVGVLKFRAAATTGVVLTSLLTLGIPCSAQPSEDTSSPSTPEVNPREIPQGAPSPTTNATPEQSSEVSTTSKPEPPINAASDARPSLDYEPSESISEDRSVSFPVDI